MCECECYLCCGCVLAFISLIGETMWYSATPKSINYDHNVEIQYFDPHIDDTHAHMHPIFIPIDTLESYCCCLFVVYFTAFSVNLPWWLILIVILKSIQSTYYIFDCILLTYFSFDYIGNFNFLLGIFLSIVFLLAFWSRILECFYQNTYMPFPLYNRGGGDGGAPLWSTISINFLPWIGCTEQSTRLTFGPISDA